MTVIFTLYMLKTKNYYFHKFFNFRFFKNFRMSRIQLIIFGKCFSVAETNFLVAMLQKLMRILSVEDQNCGGMSLDHP